MQNDDGMSPADRLEYLADMIAELRELARMPDQATLVAILEAAHVEVRCQIDCSQAGVSSAVRKGRASGF